MLRTASPPARGMDIGAFEAPNRRSQSGLASLCEKGADCQDCRFKSALQVGPCASVERRRKEPSDRIPKALRDRRHFRRIWLIGSKMARSVIQIAFLAPKIPVFSQNGSGRYRFQNSTEISADVPRARDGFAIRFPMIRKLRRLKLYS